MNVKMNIMLCAVSAALLLLSLQVHSQDMPIAGRYTITKLLPLCMPDRPEPAGADTLVGRTMDFDTKQIVYGSQSHHFDSLRTSTFREGEYHDARCDSAGHRITFKDFELARKCYFVVEYLPSFSDGYEGPGSHLLYLNDVENIVIEFSKRYYKLKAVDLPGDFKVDFTIPRGWKKVNDTLFVLSDFNKEFKAIAPSLARGHQPWRGSPRLAAAASFLEFGVSYKFSDVFLFGGRLVEIKPQEIFSVNIEGVMYRIHVRLKQRVPIPDRLEIKTGGG
jgi:hypothetical protein